MSNFYFEVDKISIYEVGSASFSRESYIDMNHCPDREVTENRVL